MNLLRLLGALALIAATGCEPGGYWARCDASTSAGLRTRNGGTECFCPENWVCHFDRRYNDVAIPLDGGAAHANDASTDDVR